MHIVIVSQRHRYFQEKLETDIQYFESYDQLCLPFSNSVFFKQLIYKSISHNQVYEIKVPRLKLRIPIIPGLEMDGSYTANSSGGSPCVPVHK